MAQWVASGAAFLAVIVALLPIWLTRREKKKKSKHLNNQIIDVAKELQRTCTDSLERAPLELSPDKYTPMAMNDHKIESLIGQLGTLFEGADILSNSSYRAFLNMKNAFTNAQRSSSFDPNDATAPLAEFAKAILEIVDEYLSEEGVPAKKGAQHVDSLASVAQG